MEIKKCEGKENQFILNNKKVIIKKEISEQFYQLIKEKKYDDAFDLIGDSNIIDDKSLLKKLSKPFGFLVIGAALLYLSSKTGINIFSGLSFITFGASGGLFLKEGINIFSIYKDKMKILEIITEETKNNENKKLDIENTKSLEKEKTNTQSNSYVFDKNKNNNPNIIDLEEYKNKHR